MIYNSQPLIPNPELGYYSCNNLFFNSKIEACIYGTAHKTPVQWHFNDDIFDNYPWHIEPSESLDELYNKRAREIREKYDYVMLAFSGGGDSNNILESFLRQGLLIDEIVTNVMGEQNSVTVLDPKIIENWNEAAEFKFQTLPRLEHVKKVSPKTKITILDLSSYVLKFFNEQKDESWLNFTKERLKVSGLMRHNFIHFNEVRKQFDKGKNIVMVLGIEKPRTRINRNNELTMFFGDQAVNIATTQEFMLDYSNAYVENFYWHPSCATMIAKQVHVIKKFLENTPVMVPCWTPSISGDFQKMFRSVHERVLRPILYSSTWHSSYWQANKSTLDWYSEIDNWFLKGFKDTKEFGIWQAGLQYVYNNATDYLKPTTGNQNYDAKNKGLRPFIKEYIIGKMNSRLE
jgi:hypothetical protein